MATSVLSKYYLMSSINEFLKSRVELTQNFDKEYQRISLLCHVMTPYSTLLILSLENNNLDLAYFEFCLQLACEEIMLVPKSISEQGLMNLRTGVISIVNRFLLIKGEEFLEYVSTKVNVNQFLLRWAENMEYICSKKAQKINALAIFKTINVCDPNLILPIFDKLMIQAVPEVYMAVEMPLKKNNNRTRTLSREQGFSHRKAELQNLQLYDEVNMLEIFKTSLGVIFFLIKEI